MKDISYYENKMNEIRSIDSIKSSVYKANGFDTANFNNMTELKKERARLDSIVKEAHDRDKMKYKNALDEFKNDLFEELGITENPKRDILFAKAWENGHSSGLYEVYSISNDLVELIL